MTDKDGKAHLSSDLRWMLILLVVLLFVFQYVTLSKFSVLPPGKTFITLTEFVERVEKYVHLGWVDGVLSAAILAAFISLAALELWRHRLTSFLAGVFASERATLALLAVTSLVCVRFYLAPGEVSWSGDASQHISYCDIVAQAIAQGELPLWTNYLSTGSPSLQFYGFLFFYLVGIVDLFIGELFTSMKFALVLCHVASGVTMYLLSSSCLRSRQAGFIAGLCYVLSFWHTQQVLVMGRLPLALLYALLPLPFYYFERIGNSATRRTGLAAGALTLGMLAYTHPGYALFATLLFAVYVAIRCLADRRRRLARITGGLFILGGGLALGAFLTLGMWLEFDLTGFHDGHDLSGICSPTWQHLLFWSNFRFWLGPLPEPFHWYGGYLGVTVVALGISGALASLVLRDRRGRWASALAAAIGLSIALILVFGYRWPALQAIPAVKSMSAVRYLLFVVFFLSLCAGAGARFLRILSRRHFRGARVTSLLLLAILADLGPTTFQHPYRDSQRTPTGHDPALFRQFREAAEPFHRRGELPDYRIMWSRGETHASLAVSLLQVLTATPTIDATHPGNLRTLFWFIKPFERFADGTLAGLKGNPDLLSLPNFDFVRAGSRLLNVRHLLASQPDGRIRTLSAPAAGGPLLVSHRITGVEFPLSVSRRVRDIAAGFRDSSRIERALAIVEHTGASPTDNSCEQILLLDYKGERDLGAKPTVTLIGHKVWNSRAEITVETSAACFARLAYAFHPHTEVIVNGKRVEAMQTAGRFTAVELDAGRSVIVLNPSLSPARRALLAGDLLLAATLVVVIWRGRSARRSTAD